MKNSLLIICCLAYVFFSNASQAAPPVVLGESSENGLLGRYVDALEDPEGQLTIEQVTSAPWQDRFVTNETDVPNYGTTNSFYWFRLTIKNPTTKDLSRFLSLGNAGLKYLDIYVEQPSGWEHTTLGYHLPFDQRPVKTPGFYVPLELKAEHTTIIYFRLQAPDIVILGLSLLTTTELAVDLRDNSQYLMFFLGVLTILAISNFVIFLITRDIPTLYYVFFNITVIGSTLAISGYTFQYFWPNLPHLHESLNPCAFYLNYLGFLFLTQSFLNLKQHAPRLNRLTNIVSALIVLCMVLAFILPYTVTIILRVAGAVAFIVISFSASMYMLFKGVRAARYIAIGWGLEALAQPTLMLAMSGILPLNFWTVNASSISLMAFSIIISMAMAIRLNETQAESLAAQEQALREAQEKQRFAEENMQLQHDNLRMAMELDVSHELQNMVLPRPVELTQVKTLDIACWMQPADEVGGDYYDVLQYHDKVIIGMGDVSGHGLASGVIMLMLQTAVRTLSVSNILDSEEFFQILNKTFYDNVKRMEMDKNITLVIMDYTDGHLRISGQHEEVLVIRKNGEIERIDTFNLGFMLGVIPDISDYISVCDIVVNPGDGIVLYTDGITEAFDVNREQYGVERLSEIIRNNCSKSAMDIRNVVIKDLNYHTDDTYSMDDYALMVIKRPEV